MNNVEQVVVVKFESERDVHDLETAIRPSTSQRFDDLPEIGWMRRDSAVWVGINWLSDDRGGGRHADRRDRGAGRNAPGLANCVLSIYTRPRIKD